MKKISHKRLVACNTPDDLMELCSGYWGPGLPDYPVSDWQYEVANGDTRLGYWDWVFNILKGYWEEINDNGI